MRKVVITGLGVVSAVGNSVPVFFENLLAGRSGVSRMPADYAYAQPKGMTVMAAVQLDVSQHFKKSQLLALDRCSQFSMLAVREALADARLDHVSYDRERIGTYWGTSMGGVNSIEETAKSVYGDGATRVSPFSLIRIMPNCAAANLALEHQLRGPSVTFSNACASSAVAIGEAFRAIQAGYADAVVAGGAEAMLTPVSIKMWESLRALAIEDPTDYSASCKPFDMHRSGLVLGEGAGCVILEEYESARRRRAKIYGEMLTYASTCDASHMTKPAEEGQARALKIALQLAGLQPGDIDYINAHGTATLVGDEAETNAIKSAFGSDAYGLAISSTKSMHGHTLGAAGAIEFIAATLAVHQDAIPPTAHLSAPDPACDLDYVPNVARCGRSIRAALSSTFAFGGANAVLGVAKLTPAGGRVLRSR